MSDFEPVFGCSCKDCVEARAREQRKADERVFQRGIAEPLPPKPAYEWGAPNLGDILQRAQNKPVNMMEPTKAILPKRVGATATEIREFHNNPEGVQGERLSAGHYGAVYAHENQQLVVKSFEVNDGYTLWSAYAAAAYRSGMGSSVLPRVYAMSLPAQYTPNPSETGRSHLTLGYALVERLECTLSHEQVFNNSRRYPVNFSDMRDVLQKTVRTARDNGNYANAHVISTGVPGTDKLMGAAFKQITRFMSELIAAGISVNEDMHDQNWMIRNTGDVVMTDPVSAAYKSDANKVLALADSLCKRANTFTPGFYSKYRLGRTVDVNF